MYQKLDEADKNHKENATPDDTIGEGRMYSTGSSTCPVASFRKYIAKLHPEKNDLWQRPLDNFRSSGTWYCKSPIGKNRISKQAGLSITYTNHSIRATCITGTLLDEAGMEARRIMHVSGHRSETSIRSYASRLNDTKKRQISETLSNPQSCCLQVRIQTPFQKIAIH